MDLPVIGHLNREKGKGEPEYYLALEIANTRIKSAVWVVINNQTEVVATGTVAYWQGKDVEELVRATDDTLASLAQKLAEITEKEPSKVVLGLPASWVGEDNKIVKDKADFLKELTKRLELSLMGFVVTPEALVQYLKGLEGMPPSIILIELAEEEIEVTLVHLGKILGRQKVARSVDLGADLEEGLTRFLPQTIFPSRILMFDGHASLEEARQQLLDYPWSVPTDQNGEMAMNSKLSFLHLPKVEVLSEEETVKAVALSGGAEAAKAIGLTISMPQAKPLEAQEIKEAEKEIGEIESDEADTEAVEPEAQNGDVVSDDLSDDFGFVVMGDIRKNKPIEEEAVSAHVAKNGQKNEELRISGQNVSLGMLRPAAQMTRTIINRLTGGIRTLHFGKVFIILILLFFILGIIGSSWWFLAKAAVAIEVQSKTAEKEIALVLDTSASSVDLDRGIIPVQTFQGQISGQKSIGTTGKKTVGNKAKGEVVIYNSSGNKETLKTGILISSSSGLKYSLNESVTIASASGTADNNVVPGQAVVGVTAADFGSEYNLAGGTVFNIPGFSQVQLVAKNAEAFSGGEKREVQAVDKTDLTKLSAQLTDELKPKSRDDLSSKIPADFQLVEDSISFKAKAEQFDKQLGDEATTVTMSVSVTSEAIALPNTSRQALLEMMGTGLFPEGYQVDLAGSSIQLGKLKTITSGTGTSAQAAVKLVAVPFIKRAELIESISGKDTVTADQILAKVPGFIREEIKISPEVFSLFPLLPLRQENITIILNTRQD